MITGYNTDVRHRDVVFHVQTEDKGEQVASVESLVYVGGRVLARRQVTYRALLARGEGRSAIARLMDRQHRLMISQIRGGRFDPSVGQDGAPATGERAPAASEDVVRLQLEVAGEGPVSPVPPREPPLVPGEPAAVAFGPAASLEELEEDRLLDALAPVPGSVAPPPVPPPAPSPAPQEDALSLDQVIFDYLASIAAQEQLVLLMDESPALASGATSLLEFRTHTSRSGRPIQGAAVSVRMISTQAPPRALALGETDGDGLLRLSVVVPPAAKDTAALIITAASPHGDAEIKVLL
jgi:hypothetical protein